MSFATDISQPDAQRIVLFEIDIPLISTTWINYQAGIWILTLLDEQQTITDDRSVTGYYKTTVQAVPKKIGSCLVNKDFFTKVSSVALCVSTEKSFYFDETNEQVYIHFEDWAAYLNQIIRLGATEGYCDVINSNGAYYDGLEYESRIKSVPSLSQKKDPFFYGVQSYQAGTVSLINTDGKFDSYNDLNIYGQPGRLKVGIDGYTYDQFEQQFEGFIEDYPYDNDVVNFKLQDKRKNLSRKIPFSTFDQTFYPDLNDDDIGKYKPIVFGAVYYYPLVCLNKDESSSDRIFMYLDTEFGDADVGHSLLLNNGVNAYIKNDQDNNIYDQVTIQSIDLTTGEMIILASDIDNDETPSVPRDVFFSGLGYVDSLGEIDALEYLINNFSSISYNSTFFNTTEISAEFTAGIGIGYWGKKPNDIHKIISKIMFASDGFLYVQNDGRYSAKRWDEDRLSTKTIQSSEWITDPKYKFNTGSFLTKATVNGQLHNAKREFLSISINTDYEDDGILKYKKDESKTIDTICSSTYGTGEKSENIMLQSKDIVRVVTRTGDMSLYDVDVMDFITTSNKRQSEDEVLEVWEVAGKNLDLTNWNVTLEMKYMRPV